MKNSLFVFDTNTLISAFLSKQSKPKLAYEKAKRIGKLSASIETFDEFCSSFIRDKFDKYISLKTRIDILEGYREVVVFLETSEIITACRDPNDNKFLELAVTGNASCIITGDEDLLELNPFRGISIVNASDFLNMKDDF